MVNKCFSTLFLIVCLSACINNSTNQKMVFLTENIPSINPIEFNTFKLTNDQIIHKGIFSPDLTEYYFTVSDANFKQFDVYRQKKENGSWSNPKPAFFNSNYSDHGMIFSPDGNTLYFSSTRPTEVKGVPDTWHLWKSDKKDGEWSKPSYIEIPNLKNKLLSHPAVSNTGKMYFHASELDYSKMDIYYSENVNGKFRSAQKLQIPDDITTGKCTPFISPSEDYLIFASIGDDLDLMITFKKEDGQWTKARKLNDRINTKGQGNPYVTPDQNFLFFTALDSISGEWKIKWVNIENELQVK